MTATVLIESDSTVYVGIAEWALSGKDDVIAWNGLKELLEEHRTFDC